MFQNLILVFGVAIVLATLFTAWNPGSPKAKLPSQENIAALLTKQQTTPTATYLPSTPSVSKIGIVAGHWGNDSGTVCSDGKTEVEVNLNIAFLVQKALVREGYQVEVLHEFDEKLRDYSATALVSIHADSCDYINDQATGFKVAPSLANPHPERAGRLTACLRSRYGKTTALPIHSTSVTPDMTSYHAFSEVNEDTTAAIIEVGFMNLDRQFLEQNPDRAAQGIVDGILCFIRNEDISTPVSSTPLSPAPTLLPSPPP
jgi:N-acetylmuramoyl-L-alanine amidase